MACADRAQPVADDALSREAVAAVVGRRGRSAFAIRHARHYARRAGVCPNLDVCIVLARWFHAQDDIPADVLARVAVVP